MAHTDTNSSTPISTKQHYFRTNTLPRRRPRQCLFPNCASIELGPVTAEWVKRHIQTEHPLLLDSNNAYRCHVPGCDANDELWARLDYLGQHLRSVHRIDTYDDLKRTIVRRAAEFGIPSDIPPHLAERILSQLNHFNDRAVEAGRKTSVGLQAWDIVDNIGSNRLAISTGDRMLSSLGVRSEDLLQHRENLDSDVDLGVHTGPASQTLKMANTRRAYQPVDVLLASKPDIPPGTTLEGLLHAADSTTKKADVFLKYSERLDMALQEWAKASYLIEHLIPNHEEYHRLTWEPVPEVTAKLEQLKKWITAAKPIFKDVRKIINEHNSDVFELEGLSSSQLSTQLTAFTEVRSIPSNTAQKPIGSETQCSPESPFLNNLSELKTGVSSGSDKNASSHTFKHSILIKDKQNEKGTATSQKPDPESSTSKAKDSIQSSDSNPISESSEEFLSDFTPSYLCHIRSCPNYRVGFESLDGLRQHYQTIHGQDYYLCDYSSCQSSSGTSIAPGAKLRYLHADIKGSEAELRDHYRLHHKEDIGESEILSATERESLPACQMEPHWWRCPKCLRKNSRSEGFSSSCEGCQNLGEIWRMQERIVRYGSEVSTKNHPFDAKLEVDSRRKNSELSMSSVTTNSAGIDQQAPSIPIVSNETVAGTSYIHKVYTKNEQIPYEFVKQLGHGSLGVVDAVRSKEAQDGIIFARKTIQLRNVTRKKLLPLIQQEVAVLKFLSHHHIVKVLDTYETSGRPRYFGILLSPAGDEDLSHFLERVGENNSSEEDLQLLNKWQLCLTSAIAYIHSQNIRHKDIKPSNMICKGGEIYLTDFGSAHQFNTGLTSSTDGPLVGITRMYSAPEVIANDRRGRPADMFSLGCVFAEMASVVNGKTVEEFEDYRTVPIEDEPETLTSVYHATTPRILAWFTDLGDDWTVSLLEDMLAADHNRRPTADALMKILREHYGEQTCPCHKIFHEKTELNTS
ncbi:kinase-like domain-containing protein [Rutstroemia sp. NJR-2017a BVV2]|nr:kinase-like domain-containing protein [Rutstroemia sp. NJR-2017a BVV2]